jgi:mono/diheme cytochrome c family protein
MRRTITIIAALSLMALVGTAALDARATAQPPAFDGAAVYKANCASCHGLSGHGDGVVAIFLRQRPPDLTLIAKRQGSFSADRIARYVDGRQTARSHGDSQMPVWGDAFAKSPKDADAASVQRKIAALAKYLESIQVR